MSTTKVSIVLYSLLSLLGLAVFVVLEMMDLGLFSPLVPIGIAVIALWIHYPKFWIYSVTVMFYVYFIDANDGGSSIDVILGVLVQGTLFFWLAYRFLVSRQPLLRCFFDYLLFGCYLYSMTNAIIAMGHGTPFINWLREWTIGVAILYYFPLRELFPDLKSFNKLLAFASLVALVQIVQNVQMFVYATQSAEYAWQIVGRRSTPFLFLMTSMFFLAFTVHAKSRVQQLLLAGATCLSMLGVFLTYSRTAMISLLFCAMAMMFFVNRAQRIRIVTLTLGFIFVPLLVMPFALGKLAKFAQAAVVNRLTSTGKGTRDVSVQARFYEYRAVWRLIQQSPVEGYGLATPYKAFIPILKYSTVRSYIHNGYLSIVYRFGFVYALVYYLALGYICFEAFLLIRRSKTSEQRVVCIAAFFTLVCIVLGSSTDTVFYTRSTTFVLAFSYAGLGIVRRQLFELHQTAERLPLDRTQLVVAANA